MTYEEKLDEVLEWQKQQAEKDRRIKELETENAELKKELVEKGQHLDLTEREWGKDISKMIHYKTQLTKAKELLKKVLDLKKVVTKAEEYLLLEEVEQFISEVEK